MLLEGQRAETRAQQTADMEGQLSNQAVNTVRKHSTPQSSQNTNFPPRKLFQVSVSSGSPFPHQRHPYPANNKLAGSVEPLDTLQDVVEGNSQHGFVQN